MELHIPKDVIDICVEDLRKAIPYPDNVYEKYTCSEDGKGFDKSRICASMAKQCLLNEGIDFNDFMKEYVNNPDYKIDED